MTEPAERAPETASLRTAFAGRPGLFRIIGGVVSRVIILPVLATMAASLGLMLYGVSQTWKYIDGLFFAAERLGKDEALLIAIELVDLFLLATVVQVVSLGLYQLYFKQDLALPKWLKISTLDDLKSKLVGVVITVLAVFFTGQVIVYRAGPDIAYLGAAIAVVIAALTYFLSKIDGKD